MKWIKSFMYGRYGIDQYTNFLLITSLIFTTLSFIFPPLILLSYGLLFYSIYRTLSKQYYKRRKENDKYLNSILPIKKYLLRQKHKWQYRHTHKYLKCPACHQYLRVPKGKGNITITCPTCHKQFDHRT